MSKRISIIGGARIGLANVTWPFANLIVENTRVILTARILLKKLTFEPKDIICIEPYSGIISGGLKINHRKSEYKKEVIFWLFGDPLKVMKQIEESGISREKLQYKWS
jgi:hypothetical protein